MSIKVNDFPSEMKTASNLTRHVGFLQVDVSQPVILIRKEQTTHFYNIDDDDTIGYQL